MVHKAVSRVNETIVYVSSNPFDRFMVISYRLFYLIARIILGRIPGKEKRNQSVIFQNFYKGNYVNLTFLSKIYLYKFLRLFGSKKNTVEVYINKFNYKILCPLNEVDYIRLVSSEDTVMDKFNPKEGDVVVDIGAHLGRYSIISSKRVTEKGKVLSIEANPHIFHTLTENIRINGLDNVILMNCAVYSEKTKLNFYARGDDDLKNDHFGTLMENVGNFTSKGLNKIITVNANTLDNILLEKEIKENEIKWIKIDVEGAEFETLKGASQLLSKGTNLSILVKIHMLSNSTNHYEDIMNFLNNFGFEIEYQETYKTGEMYVIFSRKGL